MIYIDELEIALDGRMVLSHLTLEIKYHEKVVISGESGSGKSTLLRTLIGRHRPSKGAIAIGGKPLNVVNLTAVRKMLFYLPQEITPLGDETVQDFLKAPFAFSVNRPQQFNSEKCITFFERLGLKSHVMGAKLATLSGGERKRVGLVQGLLLDRPVLLLDELTSSVDEENRAKLVELVLSLKKTTVLAIAHDAMFMERAGRHLVLKAGRIEGGG